MHRLYWHPPPFGNSKTQLEYRSMPELENPQPLPTAVIEGSSLEGSSLAPAAEVGPRPLPVYEVEKFENTAQRRRLSVKPGLTCLWQISGRNQVRDFRDWVRLDLDYIDQWSLALDLKILLRTVPAVILGLGAK